MTADQPTVLVVDDEAELADLYATYLHDDYNVLVATGGEAALATLDDRIDVVLLDRRMPEPRGEAVLEQIRERSLDCRVALVTAIPPDFDVLDVGFDTYVCKPVSAADLREVVATLVRRSEYDSQLQTYFSLLSKRAVLRKEKPEAELATSDRYEELESRIDDLRERTAEITASFDDEDYLAAFRDLADDASRT